MRSTRDLGGKRNPAEEMPSGEGQLSRTGAATCLGNAAVARLLGGHGLARQATSSGGGGPLDPETAAAIAAERGSGRAIPDETQADLEQHLGFDFSAVRLHTGSRADVLSRAVQAEAFTTGTDVFFRTGRYDPVTSAGRELMAHELTHVVQQATGTAGRAGGVSQPTDAAEVRASEAARSYIARSAAPDGLTRRAAVSHVDLVGLIGLLGLPQAMGNAAVSRLVSESERVPTFDVEAAANGKGALSGPDACCDSCAVGADCESTLTTAASSLTVFRQATVSPGGPGGQDGCFDLLQAIIDLLNDVAQRFNDALDDRHGLYEYHRRVEDAHPDYGYWDGHRDRFYYERDRLRHKLAEWDSNDDCRGFRLSPQQQQDLTEAREFSEKEFPERPARSMREAPEPEPSLRERIAESLRKAGVPAWAVAAVVVLVIAALADPEPFTKVAAIIGAAAAIAFFVLIGRRDAVPGGAPTAAAGGEGGGETGQPPESIA